MQNGKNVKKYVTMFSWSSLQINITTGDMQKIASRRPITTPNTWRNGPNLETDISV
jgi:hypothetical protein